MPPWQNTCRRLKFGEVEEAYGSNPPCETHALRTLAEDRPCGAKCHEEDGYDTEETQEKQQP